MPLEAVKEIVSAAGPPLSFPKVSKPCPRHPSKQPPVLHMALGRGSPLPPPLPSCSLERVWTSSPAWPQTALCAGPGVSAQKLTCNQSLHLRADWAAPQRPICTKWGVPLEFPGYFPLQTSSCKRYLCPDCPTPQKYGGLHAGNSLAGRGTQRVPCCRRACKPSPWMWGGGWPSTCCLETGKHRLPPLGQQG